MKDLYPIRKNNRLKNYDYSKCGIYFVTICTADRKCVLSDVKIASVSVGETIGLPPNIQLTNVGKIVKESIENIPQIYPSIKIDNYVIMPNHIHLIFEICSDSNGRPMVAPTIDRVIKQFKGFVSKRLGKTIWQRSFYDHIIRNDDDYYTKMIYINENPVRWLEDELYSTK